MHCDVIRASLSEVGFVLQLACSVWLTGLNEVVHAQALASHQAVHTCQVCFAAAYETSWDSCYHFQHTVKFGQGANFVVNLRARACYEPVSPIACR